MSHIAHIVKGSLITSFPATNREWVTLHTLWEAIWSHHFLWPTASVWHCVFCERQSHHIFSYDKQLVSDIAHSVKGSLITSFPMTNSKWVTLHILWKAVSSHLFLWPTESELHWTFCPITPVPMTNSEWVTLHILWNAVSSHYFLWPTESEWYCTFCIEGSLDHIFFYDQQQVSDIAHFVSTSLITFFLWLTGCEWHHTIFERKSHHIASLWVICCIIYSISLLVWSSLHVWRQEKGL